MNPHQETVKSDAIPKTSETPETQVVSPPKNIQQNTFKIVLKQPKAKKMATKRKQSN